MMKGYKVIEIGVCVWFDELCVWSDKLFVKTIFKFVVSDVNVQQSVLNMTNTNRIGYFFNFIRFSVRLN